MSKFLDQFKTWIHVASGAILSAAVLYASNDGIHNAVNTVIASNKKLVAIVGAIGSVALAYANSKKSQ